MIQISFEMTDAPPRLIVTERMPYDLAQVWTAETEALYVQQWWAPLGYSNDDVSLAAVEGDVWRVVQRDPDGNQVAYYGRVEEAIAREKLVITITAEVFPDTVIRLTQDFVGSDRGTIVVSTYEFRTDVELQSYLALGGTDRLKEASGRLDHLLSQIR